MGGLDPPESVPAGRPALTKAPDKPTERRRRPRRPNLDDRDLSIRAGSARSAGSDTPGFVCCGDNGIRGVTCGFSAEPCSPFPAASRRLVSRLCHGLVRGGGLGELESTDWDRLVPRPMLRSPDVDEALRLSRALCERLNRDFSLWRELIAATMRTFLSGTSGECSSDLQGGRGGKDESGRALMTWHRKRPGPSSSREGARSKTRTSPDLEERGAGRESGLAPVTSREDVSALHTDAP